MHENDTIRIECTAASHVTRTALIDEFMLSPEADPNSYLTHHYRWTRIRVPQRRKKFVNRAGVIEGHEASKVDNLLGDVVFDYSIHGANEKQFVLEGRKRFRMKCPLCPLALTVRAERLDDALDQLRHADKGVVQLSSLVKLLS